MSNVLAGIGRGQLKVLDRRVEQKRFIINFYNEHLSGLDGLEIMPVQDYDKPNYWLSCILLSGKVKPVHVVEVLETENIESRPIWKPMHLQPFFKSMISSHCMTRAAYLRLSSVEECVCQAIRR